MKIKDVREIFNVDNVMKLPSGAQISVEKFSDIFNDAPANPSYEELIQIDGYVDENSPGKGYKTFFDKCKEEGKLS